MYVGISTYGLMKSVAVFWWRFISAKLIHVVVLTSALVCIQLTCICRHHASWLARTARFCELSTQKKRLSTNSVTSPPPPGGKIDITYIETKPFGLARTSTYLDYDIPPCLPLTNKTSTHWPVPILICSNLASFKSFKRIDTHHGVSFDFQGLSRKPGKSLTALRRHISTLCKSLVPHPFVVFWSLVLHIGRWCPNGLQGLGRVVSNDQSSHNGLWRLL